MKRCGYTVLDDEGYEQPCDRPATEWRWYQGHDHEDVLDEACGWHSNEGGRRLATAEAILREGLADESLEATGVMERALDALNPGATA